MFFKENLVFLINNTDTNKSELAKYLETSRSQLDRYTKGDREPNISRLIQIASFFSVSLDDLVLKDLSK